MHCDTTRAALLDFSNGETGPLRAWAIRRHLASCAECAKEFAALQQFNITLRRADLVPPENIPAPVPTRRAPLRRTLAAAMAVLIVGALFLLPTLDQSRRNAQNPGAAIAAALSRVNTWHFAGWKQVDGKQVSWEVWGRRAPLLYYERVGDIITWDDGKRRLRVFAPDAALKRPQGLLIKSAVTDTTADVGFQGDPAYQSLVSDQVNHSSFGDGFTTLYAQTPAVAKFRRQWYMGMSGVNENKLYTISKQDWLPMTYQLHFENPKFARDTEYLEVHYDVDLPDYVVNPPSPDGYSVIDFTQSATEAAAPSGSQIAESHGFQVQAEPVGMDKEGNVLIAVRGWLGGNRLLKDTTFTLNVSPLDGNSTAAGISNGKACKYLYALNSSVAPGGDILLPYAPLEPSDVAVALPKTFLLTLSASPQVQVRASDLILADGSIWPETLAEYLVTENFRYHLAAPSPAVANLAVAVPPGTDKTFRLPTQRDADEQRRIYYALSFDFQSAFYEKILPPKVWKRFRNPDGSLNYYEINSEIPAQKIDFLQHKYAAEYKQAEQSFRRRAAYWQQKVVALPPTTPPGSGTAYDVRLIRSIQRTNDLVLLALSYEKTGDKANQDKTLHQLIRETDHQSAFSDLRRRAEQALRTGTFPQ